MRGLTRVGMYLRDRLSGVVVDRGQTHQTRRSSYCRRLSVLAATLVAALSACGTVPQETASLPQAGPKPGFPNLGAALPAGHTTFDNDSLADLFVRLTHDLEWGGRRRHLLRFEGQISVGVSGRAAQQHTAFLDGFLAQLRAQTGIPISRSAAPHSIMVRFIPGDDYHAKVPKHFCVVAPGALDWSTFREDPALFGTRAFEVQETLDSMTVFIPDTAAPYLVRTCLIEEIAQALGPANDLYGLGPSIFNDDAAHMWPTRLDYLMLRVLYQPEMRPGLSRTKTRTRARAILARLNPEGETAPPLPRMPVREMDDWAEQLRSVFAGDASTAERQRAANRALTMAVRLAPASAYHCHSLISLARVSREEPLAELGVLDRAHRVCSRVHGPDDIRIARIMLEWARATFRAGRASAAYGLTEGLESTLAAHGQAERLVALYALQAAALQAIQQSKRSFDARRRAGEWGSYALGRDHADVRRLLLD